MIKKLRGIKKSKSNNALKSVDKNTMSDAWSVGIKSDLQKIKPNWNTEDVNTFVTHFVNDPIAKAFLRGAKFKSLPKIRGGNAFP